MRATTFIVLLCAVLVCVVTASPIDYPLFNQCDERWGDKVVPSGKSMCVDGGLLTTLSMALSGTRVSSRLSDERVPEYNPATLLNWVSPQSQCRHARGRAGQLADVDSTRVVPSFVESVSRHIHHQGQVSAASMCNKLFSRSSFFLVETSEPLPSVALATACNDSSDTVRIHHPTAGATDVHASSLSAIHEFTVAYSADEALNHLHRQQGLPEPIDMYTADLATTVVPLNYTQHWGQCDPRWGSDLMASQTVCRVGCLMTSVTVALNRHGVKLRYKGSSAVHTADPGTVNHWLRENGGYTSGSALIHSAISGMCTSSAPQTCSAKFPADGMHRTSDLSLATVKKYLSSYRVMAANVHNGGHYVLAYGWSTDGDRIYVRDSAGSTGRAWYSLKDDIVGWRIYDIRGPYTPKTVWGTGAELSPLDGEAMVEEDYEALAAQLGL